MTLKSRILCNILDASHDQAARENLVSILERNGFGILKDIAQFEDHELQKLEYNFARDKVMAVQMFAINSVKDLKQKLIVTAVANNEPAKIEALADSIVNVNSFNGKAMSIAVENESYDCIRALINNGAVLTCSREEYEKRAIYSKVLKGKGDEYEFIHACVTNNEDKAISLLKKMKSVSGLNGSLVIHAIQNNMHRTIIQMRLLNIVDSSYLKKMEQRVVTQEAAHTVDLSSSHKNTLLLTELTNLSLSKHDLDKELYESLLAEIDTNDLDVMRKYQDALEENIAISHAINPEQAYRRFSKTALDKDGATELCYAVFQGDIERFRELYDKETDINDPLQLLWGAASQNDQYEMIKELVKTGLVVNAPQHLYAKNRIYDHCFKGQGPEFEFIHACVLGFEDKALLHLRNISMPFAFGGGLIRNAVQRFGLESPVIQKFKTMGVTDAFLRKADSHRLAPVVLARKGNYANDNEALSDLIHRPIGDEQIETRRTM